jgi:hypothetical protein
LVIYGSAAHERRRFEAIKTVKTLDDMQKQLEQLGFSISRTALYYRFLPKNPNSNDRKRHLSAVPVKLSRPTKTLHSYHDDTKFCKSTIDSLMELASFLGKFLFDIVFLLKVEPLLNKFSWRLSWIF